MPNDICTLVVTYNREYELSQLLLNLNETVLAKNVLIIDNNSNYDVVNSVARLKTDNLEIEIITLDINTGGAGGFSRGMSECVKKGYKYVWAMDDDGFPSINCLSNLMHSMSKNNLSVIGPLVMDIKKTDTLSFTLNIKNTKYKLKSDLPNDEIYPDLLNPFNGTLISVDVIKKFGTPIKDFFIWGDEVEWLWRIRKNNVKFGVCKKSIFFHPINRKTFLGTKLFWTIDTHNIGLYCFYRNQVLMRKIYKSNTHLVIWVVRALVSIIFFSKKRKICLKAIIDGLRGIKDQHLNYL